MTFHLDQEEHTKYCPGPSMKCLLTGQRKYHQFDQYIGNCARPHLCTYFLFGRTQLPFGRMWGPFLQRMRRNIGQSSRLAALTGSMLRKPGRTHNRAHQSLHLQGDHTSCEDSKSRENSCRGDCVGNPFLLDEESAGNQEGRRDEDTADGLGGERAAVDSLAIARISLSVPLHTSY